jgi:peptidoglycan/LPS O-acetylase OafA/YrhL
MTGTAAGSMHGRDPVGRVAQLDSLRGIAALTVVWHHWRMAFETGPPRWFVAPFVAGHEAVILFFVLSGYVLALPVWMKRQPSYAVYLVRRVTRIYLPYLIAAFIAGVGCYFFWGSRLPLTPWFYGIWQTPPDGHIVMQQILMEQPSVLNTAFWSLRYEMELSLVFPFICAWMIRMGRYSGILLLVAVKLASHLWLHSRFGVTDAALTLHYAMFFVAGAALSREQALLKKIAARLDRWMLWLTMGFSLVMYFYGGTIAHSDTAGDLFTMFGTCLMIILIQDPRLRIGLKSRVADYLGRISYSSYLMHGTVLFVLLNLLYFKISAPLLALAYVVVSLIAAHIFCVSVEEPSLRLGKRIGKRMNGSRKEVNVPA